MYYRIEEITSFLESRNNLGIKPGLQRMYKMLDYMGHPEENLKTVHIAGTNGKGSTSAYIKSALIRNGWQVGTFTSPSLTGLHGHFHVNNEPISDQSLVDVVNKILPSIQILDEQGDSPTTFEILVMIAIVYFSGNTEIAVIEAGMGGAEDSTNCIKPILTIITNIEKDHTKFLGTTYGEIAGHKAGIIKQHVPLVVGKLTKEAEAVVMNKVREKEAAVFQLGNQFSVEHMDDPEKTFNFVGKDTKAAGITLRMKGSHQVDNAALAIMAVSLLKEILSIDMNKAIKGIELAALPGRFEKVHNSPQVILDGAHNKAGIQAFLNTIKQYYPNRKKDLVFAAFRDKQIKGMLELMEGEFDKVTLTTFQHERAASAEELIRLSRTLTTHVEPSWEQILESYLRGSSDNIIFISGSLHFISLVREYFKKIPGEHNN